MRKIKLGISACLLGQPVRYDGGHKFDRFLTDVLGRHAEYTAVCPEVECGLPVPREPMRLEGNPESPRLITIRSRIDLTGKILAWSRRRMEELESEQLCGFIFKSNSPSSGMERVNVFDASGIPRKTGIGIFAHEFMKHFPMVPAEDDERLQDPAVRENFIVRIFAYRRLKDVLERGKDLAALIAFHSRHKLLFMAHSPKLYREIGRLVSAGKHDPIEELYDRYSQLMTAALRLKATTPKNTNVLQHMTGYFKKLISPDEKRELREAVDQYHSGHIPLLIPLTLINHYARKFDQAYLLSQYYLNPDPLELLLRNHA